MVVLSVVQGSPRSIELQVGTGYGAMADTELLGHYYGPLSIGHHQLRGPRGTLQIR